MFFASSRIFGTVLITRPDSPHLCQEALAKEGGETL